ncbi:MAG: Thiol reductase thioredoxin [uncultured Sulfurovum sp.]|uniref:Thiol reductase thioredoxin n=1 Tax=uncultured Sulfurovum sp. TaxID=269237 RepID=A0A6S6U571_9BACT|nr:MAG: Thiol reductase thioredoxin [uncultured Sulfurovum sp.]
MELTDKNYTNMIKDIDTPVFIDFYSPTCGPCQMLTKLIDEKLEPYAKEKGIEVVKCDVSKNPKLAEAFKVRSVPFTIVIMPDEKLKYPELGLKNETYYFELIDKLAGKGSFFSRLFT